MAQLHREPLFNPEYSGIVSFWIPCGGDGNNLTLPGIRSPAPTPSPTFRSFAASRVCIWNLLALVWIASKVTFGAMESLRETLANSCPDFFWRGPRGAKISRNASCVLSAAPADKRVKMCLVSGLLDFSQQTEPITSGRWCKIYAGDNIQRTNVLS